MLTALVPAQLSAGASSPKQATYISDLLLVGFNSANNAGAAMDAKNRLISNGYTVVDTDLNGECGSYSNHIYLGYKTTKDQKEAIKDLIIVDRFITDDSEKLTENGVEYSLCPFSGDTHFNDVSGDLNSSAGGIDAHLFYNKDGDPAYAISDIVFDYKSADAVSNTDLNDGASCRNSEGNQLETPVDRIYMHAVKSGNIVLNEANDSYYRVFNTGMSWDKARDYCESLGGHLASIDHQIDEEDVKKLLRNGTKDVYWLGGKLNDGDEVEWLSEDYLANGWEHWAPGNPDKEEFGEYVLLHRVRSANRPPYSWSSADNACSSYGKDDLGFICEWDKEMVYFYAPMTEPAEYLVTTTTTSAATTSSVVYTHLYGDVNCDGIVDAKDASCVLAYYALVSTAEGDIPRLKEFTAPKTA